ncbi:MAG: FtsX-like permease family protein, partial [Gammaproteobacteria bacterium]|nr:FtsX-like permease family protein [Gammaproteobacteria bacterium]
LGVAVHTINASAVAEMEQAARLLAGDADLRVEAGRGGLDERVFATVLGQDGVAAASPVIEIEATVPAAEDSGTERTLRLLGIDALRVARVQPALLPRPADRDDLLASLRPGHVFLNDAALHLLGHEPGDALTLKSPRGPLTLSIAGGIGAAGSNMPLAVMDIAALQDAYDRVGLLTRIDLRLRAGAHAGEVRDALQRSLPAGAMVTTPAQASTRAAALSRAYRVNLTVLALVALFTGAFLVFSVSALSVVRRRGDLALLRVLGVTRRGLTAALTAEGAIAGLIGGLLGIAAGLLLALAAMRVFAADLGGGYFAGMDPRLKIQWAALPAFALLGTLAGAAGALLPAWEAAARPPALALKPGDEAAMMRHAPPTALGALLIGAAALLVIAPPVDGLPIAGYLAIACLLTGTLALLPAAIGRLGRLLPAPGRPLPQLAWQQLRAMPGYTVSGLATVIVSFSLVAAMAIMVHSFRASLDHWLASVLRADVYVRAPGGIAGRMPEGLAAELAALPGVRRAEPLRYRSLLLSADQAPVTLIARTLDAATLQALTVVARHPGPAPGGLAPVWISEAMADLFAVRPGARITLPLGGREIEVFVAGLWRDYARTWGAIVIDRAEYMRLTGDDAVNDVALDFADAGAAQAAVARIPHLPGGAQMEVAQPAGIRALSLGIFDRTFAVTYALEFAALLVGLAGIGAHFAALAYARRREFGMLRHLGLTRGEIGRLLALEGAGAGALGAIAGVLLGFAVSLVLIYVVNRQSFHWGMELHPPWAALLGLSAVLIALAAIAARLSGQVAMTRAAVLAVKEDA